jgi:hypothetical protein
MKILAIMLPPLGIIDSQTRLHQLQGRTLSGEHHIRMGGLLMRSGTVRSANRALA